MDMSDYQEPSPTELEQVVDEARRDCGLGPVPRSASQGLADMDARIEYHLTLLAKLLSQPDTAEVRRCIAESQRDLVEARERKREYQLQHDGMN